MRKFFLSIIAALGFGSGCAQTDAVRVMSVKEFEHAISSDATAEVLDVRRPNEFAVGHLAGAININWLETDEFKARVAELDKSKTFYIYCRSGRRSNAAAVWMKSEGWNVVDLEGGILAWQQAGKKVTRE